MSRRRGRADELAAKREAQAAQFSTNSSSSTPSSRASASHSSSHSSSLSSSLPSTAPIASTSRPQLRPPTSTHTPITWNAPDAFENEIPSLVLRKATVRAALTEWKNYRDGDSANLGRQRTADALARLKMELAWQCHLLDDDARAESYAKSCLFSETGSVPSLFTNNIIRLITLGIAPSRDWVTCLQLLIRFMDTQRLRRLFGKLDFDVENILTEGGYAFFRFLEQWDWSSFFSLSSPTLSAPSSSSNNSRPTLQLSASSTSTTLGNAKHLPSYGLWTNPNGNDEIVRIPDRRPNSLPPKLSFGRLWFKVAGGGHEVDYEDIMTAGSSSSRRKLEKLFGGESGGLEDVAVIDVEGDVRVQGENCYGKVSVIVLSSSCEPDKAVYTLIELDHSQPPSSSSHASFKEGKSGQVTRDWAGDVTDVALALLKASDYGRRLTLSFANSDYDRRVSLAVFSKAGIALTSFTMGGRSIFADSGYFLNFQLQPTPLLQRRLPPQTALSTPFNYKTVELMGLLQRLSLAGGHPSWSIAALTRYLDRNGLGVIDNPLGVTSLILPPFFIFKPSNYRELRRAKASADVPSEMRIYRALGALHSHYQNDSIPLVALPALPSTSKPTPKTTARPPPPPPLSVSRLLVENAHEFYWPDDVVKVLLDKLEKTYQTTGSGSLPTTSTSSSAPSSSSKRSHSTLAAVVPPSPKKVKKYLS